MVEICDIALNWIQFEKNATEAKGMVKLAWSEHAVSYERVTKWFARLCVKNFIIENVGEKWFSTQSGSVPRLRHILRMRVLRTGAVSNQFSQSYLAEQWLCKVKDVQKLIDDYFMSEPWIFYRDGTCKLPDYTHWRRPHWLLSFLTGMFSINLSFIKICQEFICFDTLIDGSFCK